MKIIVSHDVDMLYSSEHLRDLLLPKMLIRGLIEFTQGYTRGAELVRRILRMLSNRLHNIDDLADFDREHGVASTFFFGMARGNYLNYTADQAAPLIKKVIDAGFDCGVHGIDFQRFERIQSEHDAFQQCSGLSRFGIRMHYLNMSNDTLGFLARAGYTFDSTTTAFGNPYKTGHLWEFPLHMMDVDVFHGGKRWITRTLAAAKQHAVDVFEKAQKQNIDYVTVLFHDLYFSPAYAPMYAWYQWLIEESHARHIEFIDYKTAISELERDDG